MPAVGHAIYTHENSWGQLVRHTLPWRVGCITLEGHELLGFSFCQPFLWQLLGVGWGSGWLRQDEVPVALTHNSPGQLLSFLRSTLERAWYSSQPQPPSPTPCTGSSLLAWWAWASPTP